MIATLLLSAFAQVCTAAARPPADLPLVEVPPTAGSSDLAAVFISGDGGWAGLDRSVARALAGQGVPVVGFDSLRYFWKKRTPEQSAAALESAARHALDRFGKQRLLLIGYSFGADILPTLVNRLPKDLVERTALVVLLGLGRTASFEVHVGNWLGMGSRDEVPIAPELARLDAGKLLCIYGTEEKDTLCRDPSMAAAALPLPGGHHFKGDGAGIARRVLGAVRQPVRPPDDAQSD